MCNLKIRKEKEFVSVKFLRLVPELANYINNITGKKYDIKTSSWIFPRNEFDNFCLKARELGINTEGI